jgi:hypothetical protein
MVVEKTKQHKKSCCNDAIEIMQVYVDVLFEDMPQHDDVVKAILSSLIHDIPSGLIHGRKNTVDEIYSELSAQTEDCAEETDCLETLKDCARLYFLQALQALCSPTQEINVIVGCISEMRSFLDAYNQHTKKETIH